jgi:hypothetical protein
MQRLTIDTTKLAGFAAESAKVGEQVNLIVQGSLTSSDVEFLMFIDQISNIFFGKSGIPIETIQNFLVLIHQGTTDDIYLNVPLEEKVKLKDGVSKKKDELIYKSDIDRVGSINFGDIPIAVDDAVIHGGRVGWRFYLYFDFRRNVDLERLYKDLGELRHETLFGEIVQKADKNLSTAKNPLIITEGKTDWKHLKNAHAQLKSDLNVSFHEFEDDRGDSDTLKMCEHYSRISQQTRIIFVFDRDNPKTMKELEKRTLGSHLYQNWGNNVYSMCLPIPSHRANYEYISIEFFYKDEDVLRQDSNGCRLHFSNELRKEIDPDKSLRYVEVKPDDSIEFEKKIADFDADKIENSLSVKTGISKSIFANNIMNRETGFDDPDLAEFGEIFDVIREIVDSD